MTDSDKKALLPAATILVCRDSADGIETFMVVRHHQIDFASGAAVFPGGKVAKSDHDPALRELHHGDAADEIDQFPFKVAAVREVFEETGILLARSEGEDAIVSGTRASGLEHYREPLAKDALGISEFLQKEGLRLALDQLHFFAHWVTPQGMPKRFDTHFFLAKAPADQLGAHDGSESVDSVWSTPDAMLAEAEAGTKTVIFPTRCNLDLLGESATVDEAIERARARSVVRVEPWIEQSEDDGPMVCIPSDAGYTATRVPLSMDRPKG